MQQLKIGHWQQAKFLFKTFGKIRSAGEAGIEGYLGNIIRLFFHKAFCFFEPEFF